MRCKKQYKWVRTKPSTHREIHRIMHSKKLRSMDETLQHILSTYEIIKTGIYKPMKSRGEKK